MARETPAYKLRVRELRDVVERMIDGDAPETLFPSTWRVRIPEAGIAMNDRRVSAIAFHKPMRRSYRLSTADGRTSFHFAYSSVRRVRADAVINGIHIRPGAAREHNRYIERESAVALLLTTPNSPTVGLTVGENEHGQPTHYKETDDELRPYAGHHLAGWSAGLHAPGLSAIEHDSAGNGLRALSRIDVAHGGWRAGLLLRDAAPDNLADFGGMVDAGLRGEVDRAGAVAATAAPDRGRGRGRGARAITVEHLAYIERPSATAFQGDESRAIFTNISDDPARRLDFWQAVEASESKPGPDRMTVDVARAPTFWATVAAHADCPPELRAALAAPDEMARQMFEIFSSKEMRAFLGTIDGWIPKRRKTAGDAGQDNHGSDQSLAIFHDGRGGRVQYRIVGELPSELSPGGRVKAVQQWLREFDRLGLPYVLAIHAPDHGNNEHQWHFHLDFYDRPARLLTETDLQDPRLAGLTPVGKVVGEWDFVAKFYKGTRRDRTTRPFRRDKVTEVRESGRKKDRQQGWVEYLRGRFAFAVNQELRREEQPRRYDPRSYDEMGIKAEPGEHLGTRVSAAESKGYVSDTGLINEQKQWRAISQELQDRRAAAFREMREAVAARRLRLKALRLEFAQTAAIDSGIAMIETAWRLAINADHQRAQAQQLAARACSRANGLEQTNQRRLDAHDRGETVLTNREHAERTHVRDAAVHHLARLEPFQQASVESVMLCDTTYNEAMARRRVAERTVDTLLAEAASRARLQMQEAPLDVAARQPAAETAETTPSPITTVEDPGHAWRIRLDRDRPLVLHGPDGYYLPSENGDNRGADVQAELARRHDLQSRAISDMIVTVERRRQFLRREADGWHLVVRDAEVARRFAVLRAHPRLQKAIDRISVTPAMAAPSPRIPLEPPRVAPPSTPAAQRPDPAPVEKVPARQTEHHIDPIPDRVPASVAPASSGGLVSAAKVPILSVQRVIDAKVRLKVGRDGLIDNAGLAQQGVTIAESDRADKRLLGLARAQGDHARRAVTNFVKQAPGFIVERNGHFSLSEKTKEDIALMAREYDNPAMQIVLRMAWEQHRASLEQSAARQMVPNAPSLTTVERDDEMIAAAKAYQKEQRRQAVASAAKESQATPPGETVVPPSRTAEPTPSSTPPRRPHPGRGNDGFGR